MHTYMATRTTPDPEAGRFRRRVVFELTAEELPLLVAAERRHGSKRAGIIAGLGAIADADELEARLAETLDELGALREAGRERETKAKDIAELRRALVTATEALAESRRQREEAAGAANALKERLRLLEEGIEAEREDLYAEMDELRAERPRDLFCARCERWAPEDEWAWQRHQEGGEYAYHLPCRDHGPGLLGVASWLARRG